MGNVKVSLRVSKASYQAKLETLKGLLNEVDAKIGKFETLKAETIKFIDESDSNYDSLMENIDVNIKACRTAKSATEASIKMLEGTLNDMDEFAANAGQVLSEGLEMGKSGIGTATQALKAAANISSIVK